ncbi:MAG: Choice-of-anchor protein [Ignavibacteria bacterium]|nr:Choice-of-anchor protein [Ignavibacteria bacterium]
MKKLLLYMLILVALFGSNNDSYAASLTVFNIDASRFPTMKADYLAFDDNGAQLTNLTEKDIVITELNKKRKILKISCPKIKIPEAISTVLTIDKSGSMGFDGSSRISAAKAAAKAWVKLMPAYSSECAITTFNGNNYLNQEFTNDKKRLNLALDIISPGGGTDFNAALIDSAAGAILVAKKGKNRKVIVFLSDGQPNKPPEEEKIINLAKENNITIYSIALCMVAPDCMKRFAEQTGGAWFENINTQEEAEDIYRKILFEVYKVEPCTIEWEGGLMCEDDVKTPIIFAIPDYSLNEAIDFTPSEASIKKLVVKPYFVKFLNVPPGTKRDTTIIISADMTDYQITNIVSDNPCFTISPKSFLLNKDESKTITVTFEPIDSGYTSGQITIENNNCISGFYVSGGYYGVKPKKIVLQLTEPNGGEVFPVGADTLISWKGIAKPEKVKLSYSTNNGLIWEHISDSASGLKYPWKNIPNTPGKNCLMKVEQLTEKSKTIDSATLMMTIFGHTNTINTLAFSPDGSNIASSGRDGLSLVWDVSSGVVKTVIPDFVSQTCIGYSKDGNVIIGTDLTNLNFWDTGKEKLIGKIPVKGLGKEFSISSNGNEVAVISNSPILVNCQIQIFDINSLNLLSQIPTKSNGIYNISFNPKSDEIASFGNDYKIKFWNPQSGLLANSFNGDSSEPLTMQYTSNGKQIAVLYPKYLKIYDITNGSEIMKLTAPKGNIYSISFNKDGSRLATAGTDSVITIWDMQTGSVLKQITGQGGSVFAVSYSPDDALIAGAGESKKILTWDPESGKLLSSLFSHFRNITCSAFSPDGSRFATGSYDQSIIIREASTGRYLQSFAEYCDWVSSVCFSPDGKQVANGCYGWMIYLWDPETGKMQNKLLGHNYIIKGVCYSPDGMYLASCSKDGKINLWDPKTGTVQKVLSDISSSGINCIAYSPDGNYIAGGSDDGVLRIWDVKTGGIIKDTSVGNNQIICLAYNKTGTQIAFGTQGSLNSICLMNLNTGTFITVTLNFKEVPLSLSFHPDGKRLLYGGSNSTVRLIDLSNFNMINSFVGHKASVNTVCFNPEGNLFISGSSDRMVKIWGIPSNIVQQDVSDSVWEIGAPLALSRDVDMKQVIVGQTKDSLVAPFITNNSQYDCFVDSVYIDGADKDQFSVAGSFRPIILSPGMSDSVGFYFMPASVGKKSADIVIYTRSATITQKITGEGVLPQLDFNTNILDFGKVYVATVKDTVTALVKNISGNTLTIESMSLLGPDMLQFEILSATPFDIAPNDSQQISLRFKPKHIGRTSGSLGFYYKGPGSPAVTALFGTGIGGKVFIEDDSSFIGKKRTLKISSKLIDLNLFSQLVYGFSASVRFNSTVLVAFDKSLKKSFNNDSTILIINKKIILNKNNFARFDVIPAWGNADWTPLEIIEFNWLDSSGNILDYDTETESSKFKVLGICYEGGARLINTDKTVTLQAHPNPGSSEFVIEFNAIENGRTNISLYDNSGRLIKSLFDGEATTFITNYIPVPTTDIPSGSYILVLETPTIRISEIIEIIK